MLLTAIRLCIFLSSENKIKKRRWMTIQIQLTMKAILGLEVTGVQTGCWVWYPGRTWTMGDPKEGWRRVPRPASEKRGLILTNHRGNLQHHQKDYEKMILILTYRLHHMFGTRNRHAESRLKKRRLVTGIQTDHEQNPLASTEGCTERCPRLHRMKGAPLVFT